MSAAPAALVSRPGLAAAATGLSYAVTFRGMPACPCLAAWLPVFERELLRRGVIKHSLDIAQLIGGAAASAGTHSKGGAADVWQHDPVTQLVAREMGSAAWNRVTGSFATNRHTHLVLRGCPHNGPARYQLRALALGFSGLGTAGMGSRDTGPGPRRGRTWRQGIAWAQEQGKPFRGELVEHAIDDLTAAEGTGKRRRLIARALSALQRIPDVRGGRRA